MSARKLLVLLVLFAGLAAFMILSSGPAQAYRPYNNPPECHSIQFVRPGYWGMSCHDQDGNIESVVLNTDAPHNVTWDGHNAEMIVELEANFTEPFISWQVCDSFKACVGGTVE